MSMRTFVPLIGCLLIVSLSTASGPYDWPGCVDIKTLCSTPLSHHDEWIQTTQGALKNWHGLWSSEYRTPLTAFGYPFSLVSPQADELARQNKTHAFLLQMAALFNETDVNLKVAKTHHVLGKWKGFFHEIRDGKPVLGGRADITLNSRGDVMRWGMRTHSTWPLLAPPSYSLEQASGMLQNKIGQFDWLVDKDKSFAAFFPDRTLRGLRSVWWVHLAGEAPHARWEGIVDAATGEVLLDWSGIQHDEVSGTIQGEFWYPYNSSPTDTSAFTMEQIFINGNAVVSDLNGFFSREISGDASLTTWLSGPYCEVINDDAPESQLDLWLEPPFEPITWTWTAEDAEREELNAFYHTRFIHSWYKVLDPGFSGLDYSMPIHVNYGSSYDNAFWNGWGCYYGSGGAIFENLAMYCDVIYHEYTHGVTGRIYAGHPLPYVGQSGAMNEAWSDYFPCTITDEPLIGEGGLYQGNPQAYMRNLYNDMHFPEDWQGEVHRDSPFISGSLWRIRLALGAEIADSLAHYSRYGWANNFLDYFVEVLETDDDDGDLSNGTPHSETIYACFGHHGIGPGNDPNLVVQNLQWYENGDGGSIGDGDGWPEGGERLEITFEVFNDVILFPPSAQSVSLTVLSDDADLTITGGEQNLGDIGPGETITAEPILIDIAADARDHWTTVTLSLTAENTELVFEEEITFSIGSPKILIVKDDPTSDVESYVTNAMHNINIIFDEIELAEHENLPDSILPEPGVVLWLSGNAREGIITTNDQSTLTNYLSQGNRVVLSGQDIIDELSGHPFAQNVLEMEVSQDSTRATSIRPTPGSPLVPENWYLFVGSAGAANQRRASILAPLGDNTTLCGYGLNGTSGTAGLDFYQGQGIVFGFGIESISGMDTSESLDTFLTNLFYQWAPDILPAEPHGLKTPLPTTITLGPAFPNPFNATVQLPYQVPVNSKAELVIFDLLGREVTRISLPHSIGTVTWMPEGATGIYFAQIRGATESSPVTKLVLLK